jgi:hypothetical protein
LHRKQQANFCKKNPYVCKNKITMRKAFQLAVILLAFVPAISFAQTEKNVWTEMKKFHEVMAASFHPAEDGNFAPLKAKADELFAAARAWQKSPVPEAQFKMKETKDALRQLVIDCGAVQKAVIAGQGDEQLKTLITKAHDTFHKIAGECRQHE